MKRECTNFDCLQLHRFETDLEQVVGQHSTVEKSFTKKELCVSNIENARFVCASVGVRVSLSAADSNSRLICLSAPDSWL